MPYLTSAAIDTRMTDMVAMMAPTHPGLCAKVPLPHPTLFAIPPGTATGSTSYSMLKIAKTAAAGPKVLIVAGHHAREWAQPDALLSFLERLLTAYRASGAFTLPAYTNKSGSTFRSTTTPWPTIKRIVEELTIFVVPLANPDGREFSQKNKTARRANWRKNRAPRPAGTLTGIGVDLSRNYDIAWDYDVYYSAVAVAFGMPVVSKKSWSKTFIGPQAAGAASQPEVKNIAKVLADNSVTWCIDLHSFGKQILYPWAIESNGTNPARSFLHQSFDRNANGLGGRDGKLGGTYREYFPKTLKTKHDVVAKSMRAAILAATGRPYKVGGAAETLYPATGSLLDFAFSRQFSLGGSPQVSQAGLPQIHSFAIEFGDNDDDFWPENDPARPGYPHGFPRIELEVCAALLKFLEAALP